MSDTPTNANGESRLVTESAVLGLHDPDIGMCDLCGTEDGRRHRTLLTRTYDGEPRRVMAWLCGGCRGQEFAERANAEEAGR